MSSIIVYPTGGEYRESLYNTKLCFKDPVLVSGEVAMDQHGMPKPISGGSASVFTVRSLDGRRWAVKCFTRFVDHQEVRYERISETLQGVSKPWRVAFEYLHDGIFCNGTWYPALKMEWVDATGLIPFVEKHLWEPAKLADLAVKFAQMMADLSALDIAHGDLQHGNLLVTSSGELKLIDYDGMFVPGLTQMGACEKGHINYQSPARTMNAWGPYLDNFSAWVIYCSLVALTIEPTLWMLMHDQGDEALLFNHGDFADFHNSRALLALNQSSKSDLQALGAAMGALWTPDVRAIPALDPAALPVPYIQAGRSATAPIGNAGAAPRTVPDWATQTQLGVQSTSRSGTGNATWITGHLPVLPLVGFNSSRLALRLVASLGVAAVIASEVSAGIRLLPVLAASAATTGVVLAVILVSALLFRRTHEWQARHEKLIILHKYRAESAKVDRAASKLRNDRDAVDARERKELANISRRSNKAKSSEIKEISNLDKRVTSQFQRLERQKQRLQNVESIEFGNALRSHQQQYVTSYLGRATISSGKIPGIGQGVVSSLAASGICSAADFTGLQYQTGPRGGRQLYIRTRHGTLVRPSGVGEKKGRDLDHWRRSLEARAMSTLPSALPTAQAQAITSKYQQQRQELADHEKAFRDQDANDRSATRQRWIQQQAALSGERVATQQAFAQERSQVNHQLTDIERQAAASAWQQELAERELAAYRNISYIRYVADIARG
jgi:hypothetical protein